MILYFSGTGNSKYVADFLADRLEDETVSLGEVLKNDLPLTFSSEKPFVWIAPIYAWRFPKAVDELFKKAYFSGNQKIYFVATMGGDSGNCHEICKKRTEQKGMIYGGFADIVMPDNYFGGFSIENDSDMVKIVKAAHPAIEKTADTIAKGSFLNLREKTSLAGIKSGLVNFGFSKFMIANIKFTVNGSCTGCGECERLCPVNNISMDNGKPIFSDKCMSCYSCIHRCKNKAINLGKKTENKSRYVCIDYGKDTI